MSAKLRPTKAHREQIAALETAGFKVTFLRFGKGDHMIVEARQGEAVARVSLAGTPRVRGDTDMVVATARRRLRHPSRTTA